MNLNPNEIDNIEEAGYLNGAPVKMIRMRGGFYIATGKPKGKLKEEAIATGSHPGIVKFNLEKQYATDFEPIMLKSEMSLNPAVVKNHSHFLSEDLKKSGYDIYSIQNGSRIEFQLTKHDIKVGNVSSDLNSDELLINKMNISKDFSGPMAGAATEKALSCGVSKVKIQG